MKRVLSISGGGMRGVIPARMLAEIERRTGRMIHELFDLVCGTSTGGILACLAAAGVSAVDALRFYHESGPRIFNAGWRKLYSAGGAIHTKYGNEVLSRELKASIGLGSIGSAKTRLMVTTLRNDRKAEMVKSWESEWAELQLWEAALMTSAAQTYFPQAEISRSGKVERYLDGGNIRNAPMACAAFEAGRLWWGEPILLVHLGTGRARNPKLLSNGGAIFWAAEIFDCTTNGDDSYDEYFCRGLETFVPGFRYRRFDVDLEHFPAMDDASERTLAGLERLVDLSMHTDREPWDALMRALKQEEVAA